MKEKETLGHALDNEGSSDQKSLCTNRLLALSKHDCIELLQGHDAGINSEDKAAFNALCKHRVNKVQPLLPWHELKLNAEVDPNW